METPPANLDVWVLAGQSNMQGYGLLRGALPPDPRVWNFSSAGRWTIAEEPLHRLWESYTSIHLRLNRAMYQTPEDIVIDRCIACDRVMRVGGAGLGLSFGITMAEALQRPVGLIPCAHGGTTLEQWSCTDKAMGGDSLYGAMLDRITRAGGHLRGVLWYQGESDCTPADAPTYAERFDAWLHALRADVGNPNLPLIMVQLGRQVLGHGYDADRAWGVVRHAQATLPARMPHSAVTSAIDLGLEDHIHINTAGLIRLGKRLAQLALPLYHGAVPTSPRIAALRYGVAPGVCAVSQAVTVAAQQHSQHTALPIAGFGTVLLNFTGVTGGWAANHPINGFGIYTADGAPHPSLFVLNAELDADDPTAIRLLLSAEASEPFFVGYGMGRNPYCTLVDQADMPLCAFLPMPVQFPAPTSPG